MATKRQTGRATVKQRGCAARQPDGLLRENRRRVQFLAGESVTSTQGRISYEFDRLAGAFAKADFKRHVCTYLAASRLSPLLLHGDARRVLTELPDGTFDMCMTSPPYWGKRVYANGGIGQEAESADYLTALASVLAEVRRTLKPAGSLWLNIGDTYSQKRLLGLPWQLALMLSDKQGWVLRDCVIWNKLKGGMDNSTDRLRNMYEYIFHFVKSPTAYYFDADAVRMNPKKTRVVNGAVVSASGVSGIRYRRQIERSSSLSDEEKSTALAELDRTLDAVRKSEIADFRMIIRGQQRATHSDAEAVSGRARELRERGFYFLRYHPNGSKPGDVWDILPEDTQRRDTHFASYPEELCRIPILTTCPPGGVVLDPFCGTGTTMLAARNLNRKSVGIDVAVEYLRTSEHRCASLL